MDPAAVAVGLEEYASPAFEWRYASAEPLHLLGIDGTPAAVGALLARAPQTILVLGRNLL
jgi:hypothetical protein